MRTTVHIENIKCDRCIKTIMNRLLKIDTISEVDINTEACTVAFDYHTEHDFEMVKHALSRIGYPIVGTENRLKSQ